jgi:hypothetical protein
MLAKEYGALKVGTGTFKSLVELHELRLQRLVAYIRGVSPTVCSGADDVALPAAPLQRLKHLLGG